MVVSVHQGTSLAPKAPVSAFNITAYLKNPFLSIAEHGISVAFHVMFSEGLERES